MDLPQLAHRISTDVMLIARKEHRLLLLQYVMSGFDSDGNRIEHANYQRELLRAISDEEVTPNG